MCYHQLPSWKDYWRNDQHLSVPFISDVMPRNRFLQILSNIHVNDNTAVPNGNTDRLYKLHPLINTLNNNFTKLSNVSRQVSIDESMIIFKGRSSMKQYNPMKPITKGYLLWAMGDMDGYLYNFEIYQRKNQEHSRNIPKYFGLDDSVVHQLTERLSGNYHEVYVDHFFTSIPLILHIHSSFLLSYFKRWYCRLQVERQPTCSYNFKFSWH